MLFMPARSGSRRSSSYYRAESWVQAGVQVSECLLHSFTEHYFGLKTEAKSQEQDRLSAWVGPWLPLTRSIPLRK